jgi:ABC-type dipeptide/oligopeptide/nickel transport system ATPase subunit
MTKIQTQRQASTKALSTFAGFLNFDPLLYKDSPLTLGLLPEDITLLLNVISERTVKDEHLINRLTCYLEQVTYAHSHPGIIDPSLFTPKTWGKATPLRYEYGKQYHPYINPKHLREWLDSGIDPTLILANLESFYHENLGKKFTCNFAVNSPGWAGYAVDLLTGLTDLTVSTHFKPDTPYTDGKGRSAKYLCQSKNAGKSIDAVLHNTLNPNYWQEVIESDCPIIITEGTKKALCGLSHGLPTIALLGTWMGIDKVDKGVYELKESLKLFMQGNRVIYLAFDSDITHKQSVYDAMLVTANAIQQVPNFTGQVKVVTWKYSQLTKGMDDFIKHEGIDAFRALLENAYTLEAFIDEHEGKGLDQSSLELEKAIVGYLQETSPTKKVVRKSKILNTFSHLRQGKDWDNLVNGINSGNVDDDCLVDDLVVTAIDFINDDTISSEVNYLVDELIATGNVTMLSGDSGAGKSTLCYDLAKSVALGEGYFATREVLQKGKVLYIQSDEPPSVTKQRMINMALGIEGLDIIPKSKFWSYNDNGLSKLKKLIDLNNYVLVIIDNIDTVKPDTLPSLEHNTVGDVMITPLTKLAIDYDVAFVILNHTPKYVTTVYGGHNTLKKQLFTNLILTANTQTGVCTLKEDKARMHKPKTITYRRGDNDKLYDFQDITEGNNSSNHTDSPKLTNREKVINALQAIADSAHKGKHDGKFTAKSIAEDVGVSKSSVETTFRELAKEWVIVKGDKRNSPYTMTSLFNERY